MLSLNAYRRAAAALVEPTNVRLQGPGVALNGRLPHVTQSDGAFTCAPMATLSGIKYFHPWCTLDEVAIAHAAWLAAPNPAKAAYPPSLSWCDLTALAHVVRTQGLHARAEIGLFQPLHTPSILASAVAQNQVMVVGLIPHGDVTEGHFVAVEAVDAVGVHVADSYYAPYHVIPWGKFLSDFHNVVNHGGAALRISASPIITL